MFKRLMTVAVACTLMLGCSTSEDDDGDIGDNKAGTYTIEKSDTLTVAENATIVTTEDGVKVDFGCLLENGEKVTVEKVSIGSNDPDVEITAYNFELSTGEIDGAVVLTIPYDETGIEAGAEQSSICGKYYNDQTSEWEDVFYSVDTSVNEVTITTNHFSIYGVFKIKNPTKRNAYIYDLDVYASYMTSEQAEKIINTCAKQGSSWQEDVVSSYLGTTGTSEYFTATNVHTLLTMGGAYSELISEPFQGYMTNLGIATACLQFASDAYNYGLSSDKAAISAMKTTLNIAVNFASSAVQLAYISVGVIDIALSEVLNFAIATKYASTKNMYDAYYKRPENARNLKKWRTIFKGIYKRNKETPEVVQDSILAEIDNYVKQYWSVASSDWESWIDAYEKNGTLSKYPWPSAEDQETISNNFKKEIFEYLASLFLTMSRDIQFDIMDQRDAELKKIAAYLNTVYTITINETVENGMIPLLPDCLVKMSPLANDISAKDWTVQLDNNGSGVLKFTVIAHENAGFPMTLEFYKTTADLEKGTVAKTYKLSPFESQQVAVDIKTAKEKIDFTGTYEGTFYSYSTGITEDATTVITLDSVFGTDGLYSIQCSCSGKIKGINTTNCFIRQTNGFVNLPGSDFYISVGSSPLTFTATLKNVKDEPWAIVTGTRID